jgi:membrane protein
MVIPGVRGMSLWTFFRKLHLEIQEDAVTDSAAQVSYYLLFSLFPFLFFLVTLTAYLPPLKQALRTVIQRAAEVMPPQAFELIHRQIHNLLNEPRPKLLTAGLLISFYSASRGTDAFRKALNLAYDVTESRPYWKTQLIAIGMTLVSSVLVVLSFTMIMLGGEAGKWVFDQIGWGAQFVNVWSWLRFPLTGMVVMLVAALGYFFLPDVVQKFKYITPGSVLGTVLWLTATWGFTFYSDHFGHYNVTYGSLGGVVLLLTWFYISSLIFIVGAEVNAIIEHASKDGKRKGARAPGESAPPPELRASHLPVGAAKKKETAEREIARRWQFWRRRPAH